MSNENEGTTTKVGRFATSVLIGVLSAILILIIVLFAALIVSLLLRMINDLWTV